MQLPWMVAECRGIAVCEIAVAIAVEFRVNCRVLEDSRANRRGWPRNAVVFRGNCSGLTSVEIAVAIAVEFRGNCCGWLRNAVFFRGNCSGLDVRGNWRGNCRGGPL